MFFDGGVDTTCIDEQEERYRRWMSSLPSTCKLAIIEAGAGVAITSIRSLTERVAAEFPHATVVRINVEHSGVPPSLASRACSFGKGVLESLRELDARIA